MRVKFQDPAAYNKYLEIYARQHGTCVIFPLKNADFFKGRRIDSLHSRSQGPVLRHYLVVRWAAGKRQPIAYPNEAL